MIVARPFAVKIDAAGLTSQKSVLAQNLRSRLGGTWEFVVEAGGKRGAALNALIAKVQAGRERDPFYPNKRAIEAIRFAVNGLASTTFGAVKAAEKAIGDALLISIAENVEAQRNPGGSKFKPLTEAYARRKQKAVGFVLPILRATGDLLGGLRVRSFRRQ